MASFVQLMSTVRLYEVENCDDADLEVYDCITSAISMGAISTMIALLWLVAPFVKKACPSIVDAFVMGLLLALWTFGAMYLTFDEEQSPAVAQGNL
jgi:hypothetical protein